MTTTVTNRFLQATLQQERLCASSPHFHAMLLAERPRLLRLSYAVLHRAPGYTADVAEDVVQEALLEAWRSIDNLREPSALRVWLSGITRNVCARWLRQQKKRLVLRTPDKQEEDAAASVDQVPADFDLEIELERSELALLLDRALALLPEVTREVLVQKFVADLPYAAIGEELGLSENAVAVRVHRGKLALQKLLQDELRPEAESFGLVQADDVWRETRLWCTHCGKQRLLGRLDETEFALRCPRCHQEPNSYHSQDNVGRFVGNHKTFRPALNRFNREMYRFFTEALGSGSAPCHRCGVLRPLQTGLPRYAPPSIRDKRGLHFLCPVCDVGSYTSLDGRALQFPEGYSFWKEEGRIRTLPEVELDVEGTPAIQIPVVSTKSTNTLDVILRRDTHALIGLYRNGVAKRTDDAQ